MHCSFLCDFQSGSSSPTSEDIIPGMADRDLGEAKPRDPDALPPSNSLQLIGGFLHDVLSSLKGGNAVFGLKAGVLTGRFGFLGVALDLQSYFNILSSVAELASLLPKYHGVLVW